MTTQPPTAPKSIHELNTFYLSPAHLENKGKVTATIDKAVITEIFNSIETRNKWEMVIHFSDRRRSLKTNKTQQEALWTITGTDDHTKWAGTPVILERVPARGGKFTIKISKPTE
jgi:hypothetical protein